MSRKNISLSEPIEERAQQLIKARGFSGLSDMLATLIREEYERRHPPTLQEGQAPGEPGKPPAQPVRYLKGKAKRKASSDLHADTDRKLAEIVRQQSKADVPPKGSK